MTKQHKLLSLAACMSAALVASSAMAAETPAAQTSAKEVLPRTLEGYVSQDKAFWDYLKANHPYFKYLKEGRVVGKFTMSDREEEWVNFGGGDKYREDTGRTTAVTYRLPYESFLDLPNNFVGPKKCGECHPSQYEKWERSRHNKIVRFPEEMTEAVVQGDLKRPLYGSKASVLPEGINVEDVYVLMGTPRTKYGFVDKWLVRGTYHIEDGGSLSQATGKIVAGGNQFSRGWAEWLTPEKAKEIQKLIPDFPTELSQFGPSASHQWGMTSYGSTYEGKLLFQAASSYCEVCHAFKFDFKDKKEFFAALGNPKELQKHTISRGIACEECHGEGGHLVGNTNNMSTNCDRCHQRLNFIEDEVDRPDAKGKLEKAFNAKTKSSCPSCGTEGSQLMMSKHYEKGMRCVTCHDPHEVTSNDWKDYYTKPAIRQTCQDCHKTQADVVANTNTHKKMDCVDCHMPFTMSCENFTAIQRPDMAGFDAVRRSHLFKIEVDPEKKMMNPGAGQSRASNSKGWHVARDEEGHGYVDLMWSCARTANAEKGVMDNKGCHSLFLSELEKGLQYGDQKVIYGEVMKWQNPVKDGFKTAKAALERINKLLEVTKLTVEAKTEIMLLVDKAADITKQVEEDGSWGVHAPDYLKQRVDTANAYLTQAQKILDNGNFPLIKTEAKK